MKIGVDMKAVYDYNISMANKKGNWTGSKNPRWNGGVSKLMSGYILIKKPNHPYAHKRTGYVLEHRLVIEQAIGRYLEPNEEVHHINGVKDDNRLENLELTTSSEHQIKYHSQKGKPVGYRLNVFSKCRECGKSNVKASTIVLCHNCYMRQWNRKKGIVKSD